NETYEKLFLFRKEDIIGKTSLELKITQPGQREDIVQQLNKSTRHGKPIEMKLRKADGVTIDALVSLETLEIERKKSILSVVVDITDRKKTEEQIMQLNSQLEKNIEQMQAVNKELEAFTYSV